MACRSAFFRHLQGRLLLLILLSLLLPGVAAAAKVTGLYNAEVPVAGQDAEQRNTAIQQAFRQVLVKVAGSRAIASHSALQQDIELAPRYVQQYRYRLVGDAGDESGRLLSVQFDAAAVARLLKGRRLPVWSDNRPLGLVWLGVERAGKRRLLIPELDRQMVSAMQQAAAQRGIPLLFPLMDLEDQSGLDVADLWGDFEQRIRSASQRYSPDHILTGRLNSLPGNAWRVDWRLYQNGRTASWSSQGRSSTALLAEGVHEATDRLAERFAPTLTGGDLSLVRLRITGIDSLDGYARVERLLSSQGVIEQSQIMLVETDAVTYQLRVRGGVQGLQQGLTLGGVLEPTPTPVDLQPVDLQPAELPGQELPPQGTGAEEGVAVRPPVMETVEGVDLTYRLR